MIEIEGDSRIIVTFLAFLSVLIGAVIGSVCMSKWIDGRSVQTCIASQRTAQDCALILHGTGSR